MTARKPSGILNGIAPLDGADVVCEVNAAEAVELLAEPEDTLALLLLLAEAELADAELEADPELAEVEVTDAELAEEPEADEAEAVPVDATTPV